MRRSTGAIVGAVLFLSGCGEDGNLFGPVRSDPPLFVLQWGGHGQNLGQFDLPTDLEVGPDGSVYVLDNLNERVQKFTSQGAFVAEWGHGPPTGNIFSSALSGIAVGQGRVYVSDQGSGYTWVLSEAGDPIVLWNYYAVYGGLAVNTFGTVFISGYKVVSRYPLVLVEGPALWAVGPKGNEVGKYEIPNLYAVAAGPQGTLYGLQVAHPDGVARATVLQLTQAGEILSRWRTEEPSRFFENLSVDSRGSVYLVEGVGSQSVWKFTGEGKYLTQWTGGSDDVFPFRRPAAVGVDAGGEVFVTDFERDRVVKFAPPPESP